MQTGIGSHNLRWQVIDSYFRKNLNENFSKVSMTQGIYRTERDRILTKPVGSQGEIHFPSEEDDGREKAGIRLTDEFQRIESDSRIQLQEREEIE